MIALGYINVRDKENNNPLLINTEKITFVESAKDGAYIWLVDGMKIYTVEKLAVVNEKIEISKQYVFSKWEWIVRDYVEGL